MREATKGVLVEIYRHVGERVRRDVSKADGAPQESCAICYARAYARIPLCCAVLCCGCGCAALHPSSPPPQRVYSSVSLIHGVAPGHVRAGVPSNRLSDLMGLFDAVLNSGTVRLFCFWCPDMHVAKFLQVLRAPFALSFPCVVPLPWMLQ